MSDNTHSTKDDVGLTMLLVMMHRAGISEVKATGEEISTAVQFYKDQGKAFLVDDHDEGISVSMIDAAHLGLMAQDLDEDNKPVAGATIN